MRNVNKKSDLFAEPFLEAKSVWRTATGMTGSFGIGNHAALPALCNGCPVVLGFHVPLVEVDRAPFVASDVASCFGLRAVKGGRDLHEFLPKSALDSGQVQEMLSGSGIRSEMGLGIEPFSFSKISSSIIRAYFFRSLQIFRLSSSSPSVCRALATRSISKVP